jgi:hypothetical protein
VQSRIRRDDFRISPVSFIFQALGAVVALQRASADLIPDKGNDLGGVRVAKPRVSAFRCASSAGSHVACRDLDTRLAAMAPRGGWPGQNGALQPSPSLQERCFDAAELEVPHYLAQQP